MNCSDTNDNKNNNNWNNKKNGQLLSKNNNNDIKNISKLSSSISQLNSDSHN